MFIKDSGQHHFDQLFQAFFFCTLVITSFSTSGFDTMFEDGTETPRLVSVPVQLRYCGMA